MKKNHRLPPWKDLPPIAQNILRDMIRSWLREFPSFNVEGLNDDEQVENIIDLRERGYLEFQFREGEEDDEFGICPTSRTIAIARRRAGHNRGGRPQQVTKS